LLNKYRDMRLMKSAHLAAPMNLYSPGFFTTSYPHL
jgi:hypothetical protein